MKNQITIKIGGEAGMGVESAGHNLAKALMRGGFNVFSFQDFMSRVRGGHNFFQIRASSAPVFSFDEKIHILVALTQEALDRHAHEVVRGGAIIYDEKLGCDAKLLEADGVLACPVPLAKMAFELGGSAIMMSAAAIGAVAGLTHYGITFLMEVLNESFGKKGAEAASRNQRVAEASYSYAHSNYSTEFGYRLEAMEGLPPQMMLNGNQALGLGALAAGVKLIAAYPMTPATTIFEFITAHAKKYGVVSKQTEDEIAAVLFAIGASHAGVRAMTCTSGGGFCLMVEALGLAGMTETPLVIANVQRTGPSTGFPTRTEQSDLEFIVHASHGEFPRIVLAPSTVEECFEAGWRAFNLAEKYQCPVIILSDLYLANHLRSADRRSFDFSKVTVDRGALLSGGELDATTQYKRHQITPSGISPRAVPGHKNAVFMTTSDEHDEQGFAVEDADARNRMMEKRMRKLKIALEDDIRAPELYGDADAEVTFVCWGSVYGAAREAVDVLRKSGLRTNLLKFGDLWPFPQKKARPLLEKAKRLVAVENNYTSQLAGLIARSTGIEIPAKILKYDGRPFSAKQIIAGLKKELIHVHI